MEKPFAESRAALDNEEHRSPETRKTAQWAASMSRRTGEDRNVWRLRSSLTIRPLVKSKTQIFDNGGAMSHVRCPFAAGFPARRGSRAHSPIRRGVNRYALARPPVYFSTVTAADPAPVAGGSTAVEGVVQPLPAGRGCQPLPAAARGVRPPGHCADAGA